MPQGSYRVVLSAEGNFYIASASAGDLDLLSNPLLWVGAKAPPPLKIVVDGNGGVIAGVVLFEEHPRTPATIVALSNSGTRALAQELAQPDTDPLSAHFSIRNVPPGEYRVYVFDSASEIEYRNPAVLASFPYTTVSVDPRGRTEVRLGPVKAGAK